MKKTLFTLIACFTFAFAGHAQLLWKVTGKDLAQPSYLLGTYHLAKISFVDSIPGLRAAMNSCEQVYGEVDMSAATNGTIDVQKLQSLSLLPQGLTLDSLLTTEEMDRLNPFVKKYLSADLSSPLLAAMKMTKPSILSTTLQVVMCMTVDPGFDSQNQFDTYFQREALQQGKSVGGFETMEEQMGVLNAGTPQRQAEQLMCMVDNEDYQINMIHRIVNAYYSQDMEAVAKLQDEKLHNSCDSTPEEDNLLIYNRNANWAKQLPEVMKAKSTLVAVGCLHLPGEKGLISLLQQAGYTITPVK